MSNINVNIVVEGRTEQTFIRDILTPEIAHKGVFLHAMRIGKPGHKGGNVSFIRARNDIVSILKQRSDTYVSTMFDYFRIDPAWPGMEKAKKSNLTPHEKAQIIENATLNEIKKVLPDCNVERRFIPYIEMHEFEALLFCDVAILANKIDVNPKDIEKIVQKYEGPEYINHGVNSSPSKRLKSLYPAFKKTTTGIIIAKNIALSTMRKKCPHFDSWITKIMSLTQYV